jgi:hypothetical protein
VYPFFTTREQASQPAAVAGGSDVRAARATAPNVSPRPDQAVKSPVALVARVVCITPARRQWLYRVGAPIPRSARTLNRPPMWEARSRSRDLVSARW